MPGETSEDALTAAAGLHEDGITTLVTHLGENLASSEEADLVEQHYLGLFDDINRRGLDVQVSIKLTQLGLDLGMDGCLARTTTLAKRAADTGNFLWIDMESSAYTDRTLDVFRRLRASFARVGVCLQAYLRRTDADLEALLPLGPAIRVVKGAYREPSQIAFPDKKDVDESFFRLAANLMSPAARAAGAFAGVATHDPRLIARIQEFVKLQNVPPANYEFEMLYGIQRAEQIRLARQGGPVRILTRGTPRQYALRRTKHLRPVSRLGPSLHRRN
jgi:proline dehydrogenase